MMSCVAFDSASVIAFCCGCLSGACTYRFPSKIIEPSVCLMTIESKGYISTNEHDITELGVYRKECLCGEATFSSKDFFKL